MSPFLAEHSIYATNLFKVACSYPISVVTKSTSVGCKSPVDAETLFSSDSSRWSLLVPTRILGTPKGPNLLSSLLHCSAALYRESGLLRSKHTIKQSVPVYYKGLLASN